MPLCFLDKEVARYEYQSPLHTMLFTLAGGLRGSQVGTFLMLMRLQQCLSAARHSCRCHLAEACCLTVCLVTPALAAPLETNPAP